LNEELSRLCDDVPLGNGPLALPLGLPAVGRLEDFFRELEFKSLASRLAAIAERLREDARP
jgi:hypothetical protein